MIEMAGERPITSGMSKRTYEALSLLLIVVVIALVWWAFPPEHPPTAREQANQRSITELCEASAKLGAACH